MAVGPVTSEQLPKKKQSRRKKKKKKKKKEEHDVNHNEESLSCANNNTVFLSFKCAMAITSQERLQVIHPAANTQTQAIEDSERKNLTANLFKGELIIPYLSLIY